MGDAKEDDLRVSFDSRLKLKFCGSKVTSDAGLLAYRELDEAFGLTEMGADLLTDSRQGCNKQHLLVPLLRQSIYSRLAGYEDVNDAERLAVDPAMRHVVGGRAAQAENEAASTSGVGRFETEILSTRRNLTALMNLSGEWIDKARQRQPLRELILDMDSSVSDTYGEQEGSAYNGHFECMCYHPLFLFNQFGDLEYAMLRRGNKASAKYWRRVLLPAIERYHCYDIPKFFRGDAAFANPALYRLLEKEGYGYAIRIKSNAVLEREIEHLLTRPVGRPSHKPKVFYHSFQYQAKPSHGSGRGGQDRMARGRVVPASRLHRDQPEQALEERREVLQRSRHGRAVDQGGQERCQMDEALLPDVQGQSDAFATVRLGLQPGELPATTGTASRCRALVANDTAREAGEDRSQGDAARQVRHIPTGRGGRATAVVCRDP
jgi:hypothetical protein